MISTRNNKAMGFVAFIIAAICITVFAWTADQAYSTVQIAKRNAFCTAFYLLAATMVLYAATTVVASESVRPFMLASDSLLLLATGYMAFILLGSWRPYFVVPMAFLGSAILVDRAYSYPPQSYVHDGLLYFNLQVAPRAIILILFMVVWLPAAIIIARQVASDRSLIGLQNSLVLSFVSLVLAMAVLISTRSTAGLVISFAVIILLFASQAAVNLLIIRAHSLRRIADATKRPAKSKSK